MALKNLTKNLKIQNSSQSCTQIDQFHYKCKKNNQKIIIENPITSNIN